ncbi:hypothetical protein AMJ80_08935 [bacterium SM23_31]|nr:MAG: hypothetical protein AMJ80_08935 [bacterium SM23_31]
MIVNLIGFIPEIKYKPTLVTHLNCFDEKDLLKNALAQKATVILKFRGNEFGFSQWVSPKRTRSYPYSRVYDTFIKKNRVTIIPFVKDEGFDGDRDFIQWDTISLMSLLNVYVIIGYYCIATKNFNFENKITNQIFDYVYIYEQMSELVNYQSSALHWNLKQMDQLLNVAEKSQKAYAEISKQTGVRMHSEQGITNRIKSVRKSVSEFKNLSRKLAAEAQKRELQTLQPKESLIEGKATITLQNFLGGFYFLTVDEFRIIGDTIFLFEKKHSDKKLIPSANDVKDSFIKMALFTNITDLVHDARPLNYKPIVGLTSEKIKEFCHSSMSNEEIITILSNYNNLNSKQIKTILSYFEEARQNNFFIFLMDSNRGEFQNLAIQSLL